MKQLAMFFFLVAFAFPIDISAVEEIETGKLLETVPSKTFREFYRDRRNLFPQLVTNPEAREALFYGAWILGTQSSPTDNRPYVFALALDLYNSLPPGSDPTGYNDGEIGGKGDLHRQITKAVTYKGSTPEQEWTWAVKNNRNDAKEMSYIFAYIREHVKLDDFDKDGSVKPTDINLANPTHYAELKKWLDDTAQLREQGIPPWEAAQYLALAATSETQAVAPAVTPAPATAQLSEPAPRQAQPDQSEEQEPSGDEVTQPAAKTPASSTLWSVVAMAVFVLVAIGISTWLLRRRKIS